MVFLSFMVEVKFLYMFILNRKQKGQAISFFLIESTQRLVLHMLHINGFLKASL